MNIKKELVNNKTLISISGIIDEQTDFPKVFGPLTGIVEINCQGITKINSNGVKGWINFFTQQSSLNSKIYFTNFSPVLVEQLNSLSNFCGTLPVTSLMVPFACTQCHKETIISMAVETLKSQPEPSPIKCSHCSGKAVFDDLPEEYFCCLENLGR